MKKGELIAAVKIAMMGVEKTAKLPGTDFLIFDTNWIRSFRDTVSVSYPCETGFRCAIKADEFQKVLSKIEAEDVSLEIKEDKMILKTKRTTLKMTLMEESLFEQALKRVGTLNTDNIEEWYNIPKGYIEGMDMCLPSAGTDNALDVMAGIHFENEKVIATDNHQVAVYSMEEMAPVPFTIPTVVAQSFSKLGNDLFSTIAVTGAWVHLATNFGAICSARLLAGDYPIDRVLGVYNRLDFGKDGNIYRLPEGLEKSLERAEILSDVNENLISLTQISLSCVKGNLQVYAKKEAGEISELIPWKDAPLPEGTKVTIAPEFLKKILRFTREFQLSPSKKALAFSTPNFQYIVVATVE